MLRAVKADVPSKNRIEVSSSGLGADTAGQCFIPYWR